MSFFIIAHRGGTDRFPELTLEAARHSLTLGADFVEMDVRMTADGVPVICHDADGRRLFGSPAAVASMTALEFTALVRQDAPACHGLTLHDLLHSGIAPILLHIKTGGANLPAILSRIEECAMPDQVIAGLSSPADIVTARGRGLRTLAFCPAAADTAAFIAAGADIIRLWEGWITDRAIGEIRSAGRSVWIMASSGGMVGYTDDSHLPLWRDMGVDGVLVNEIARAKRALG